MSAGVTHDRGALISTRERDYNHATDQEYQRLRNQADLAFQKRQQLSQESQATYKQGDGAKAHQLSEKAKVQQRVAEKYNLEAAEYVFVQNNADSAGDEIDLHGLYVKEALWVLRRRVANAINSNESHLRVIVGKGLHSQSGVAKIKPAVEELCNEAHLNDYVDQKNPGVIVIELKGAKIPSTWAESDGLDGIPYGNDTQQQHQVPAAAHYSNGYHPQQQPQYQQQAPQSQQYHQQQQGNTNTNTGGNGDFLIKLLNLACVCIQKNF